ncbi:hypothetical protein [Vulgatibacter sp.]|uniref:hypothetical protein n=1 Tax=Vulgatibacter sp. TaxID=1971226 RepID=UPI00356862D4
MADRGTAEKELAEQVVYALLLPAARLALALGVPVREVADQLEVAYFHETRRQGLKTREAAERMGASLRKVADLSSRLKQRFLHTNETHELPRRIEFLIWAGPESEARICQALPDVEPRAVAKALQLLVEQQRARRIEGRTIRYEALKAERRLVADSLFSRLDALQNLAANLAHAVYGRFFRGEARAFARTLAFRIRPEDLPRLQQLYEEQIWPALKALDEAARGAADADALDFSVLWAPRDSMQHDDGDEE